MTLHEHAVHVWRIPLSAAPHPGQISQWLTPGELERGRRYRRDEDRLRFQLGRAATRCLAAGYLGVAPAQVGIDADSAGKPRLDAATATAASGRMLQFNVSHSGEWILAAFARSCAVGIDVEALDARSAGAELAAHVMSERELRAWQGLAVDRRRAGFFKCWTSKEAFVKGSGVGLSAGLKSIDVCVDPDLPARLIGAPPALGPQQWSLYTLSFSDRYAATLAVAASGAAIVETEVRHWQDIGGRSDAGTGNQARQ